MLILSVCLSTHIGRELTDVSSFILFIVIWFRNWRLLTFWLLKRWFNSNCYSLKKKKLSIKRQDLLSFFKKGIMLIWLFWCFWKIWKSCQISKILYQFTEGYILEYEIAKDVFNLLKQLNRYRSVENKFIYIQSSFVTMIFVERRYMYFDGYNGYSTALSL